MAANTTGHCYLTELPLELRNRIYNYLTVDSSVSGGDGKRCIFLFSGPRLAVLQVSKEVQHEYLKAIEPFMKASILSDGCVSGLPGTQRCIRKFDAMLRRNYDVGLLKYLMRSVKFLSVHVPWDMGARLPCGEDIEHEMSRQTFNDLRTKNGLRLIASNAVVRWIRPFLEDLQAYFHQDAFVDVVFRMEGLPDIEDAQLPEDLRRHAILFHQPTLSKIKDEHVGPWPKPDDLRVRYALMTDLACTKKPQTARERLRPHSQDPVWWHMIPTDEPGNVMGFFPLFAGPTRKLSRN